MLWAFLKKFSKSQNSKKFKKLKLQHHVMINSWYKRSKLSKMRILVMLALIPQMTS